MLEELKQYIKEDDNDTLSNLLKNGEGYLNGLAGIELDFESNILAKNLLLDYCRYKFNNASEYFLDNFREDILRLQMESAVLESDIKETENERISCSTR